MSSNGDDEDVTSAGVPWSEIPVWARRDAEWADGVLYDGLPQLPSVTEVPFPQALLDLPDSHPDRPTGTKAMIDATGARAALASARPGSWVISPRTVTKWAKWPGGEIGWVPADTTLPDSLRIGDCEADVREKNAADRLLAQAGARPVAYQEVEDEDPEEAQLRRIDQLVANAHGDPDCPKVAVSLLADDTYGESTLAMYGLGEDDMIDTYVFVDATWGDVLDALADPEEADGDRTDLIHDHLVSLTWDAPQEDWYRLTDSGGRIAFITRTRADFGKCSGVEGPFTEFPTRGTVVSPEARDGDRNGMAWLVE